MLNALVRSRLLYSCQTWSCTKAQMNNVNATYLSFIRKMVKGGYRRKDNSWAYVFTNNDLLRMAGAEDVHTFGSRSKTSNVNVTFCHYLGYSFISFFRKNISISFFFLVIKIKNWSKHQWNQGNFRGCNDKNTWFCFGAVFGVAKQWGCTPTCSDIA